MEVNALSGRFALDELLDIAIRTKCFLVAQNILERLKRYDKIIECFIQSNNKHEMFRYIVEYRNVDERKIYQQIYQHFQSILEMDCEKISNIIIEYYPICVSQFLKSISSTPKLHYHFLEMLIVNGTISLETDDCNKFLVLLCQYNPEKVLEFLQNSSNCYDIQHAISVVEENNLTTSLIFLYEMNGDYKKAFNLAMDLLKEAPESLAESYATKVGSLCLRVSSLLTESEREMYWFELIEVILSKDYLNSVVKQILHMASSYVDLTRLVQIVMNNNERGDHKNFGDVKHILIGMLTNFEYESLVLSTTQNILNRDLHRKMLKDKQASEVGVYVKLLQCILCKRKLSDSIKAEVADDDQVIVFSICGHSMHNSCYQEAQKKKEENISEQNDKSPDPNLNAIQCKECGICIHESDSIYLNRTNKNLILDENEHTIIMQLKAPARMGIYMK